MCGVAVVQLIGVLHLAVLFFAKVLTQPLVAPFLAHTAVDEFLFDLRELGCEDVVQEGDVLLVASNITPGNL